MGLACIHTQEQCELSMAWVLAPAGNGGKADNCYHIHSTKKIRLLFTETNVILSSLFLLFDILLVHRSMATGILQHTGYKRVVYMWCHPGDIFCLPDAVIFQRVREFQNNTQSKDKCKLDTDTVPMASSTLLSAQKPEYNVWSLSLVYFSTWQRSELKHRSSWLCFICGLVYALTTLIMSTRL